MNLPFFIARRYLFSNKSTNAINIITWVSIVGIGVGTAAVILVLSVFNGLTGFIEDLYAAIDPDIKIVAARGQTFEDRAEVFELLAADQDVAAITRTIEGRVWLQYYDNQTFAVLKGVEPSFTSVNRLDTFVYDGDYTFAPRNGTMRAVIGNIIAAELNARLDGEFEQPMPVSISYIPQDFSVSRIETEVTNDYVYPAGFFLVQDEYDEKYIFSDFNFAQELFEAEGQVSAYELKLKNIDDAESVKKRLTPILGTDYEILTWYEQHLTLYRVMRNEKYISYLILVLMLAIAAVNIVGSLSMIVFEKKRDIAVLKSMGTTSAFIRRIFLFDGLQVGLAGGIIGLVLAFICGFAQVQFGVVKISGAFRVDAFPLALDWTDFLLVFITVIILSTLASLYPSRQAAKVQITEGIRQ